MRPLLAVLLVLATGVAYAHQPVMDMAPRWAGGYGIQTRVEHFDSQTTTWIEGVYTFRAAVRATFKLPHVDGEFGDLVLGLPLKRYVNDGARTSNWSITPSLRLPTGRQGKSDLGLSVSYSAESPRFYQLYDLYAWDDRVGLDINAGFAFPGKGGGMFALWDVSAIKTRDADRVLSGPVFVWFRRNVMFRAEYKTPVYEHGRKAADDFFNVGVGIVF